MPRSPSTPPLPRRVVRCAVRSAPVGVVAVVVCVVTPFADDTFARGVHLAIAVVATVALAAAAVRHDAARRVWSPAAVGAALFVASTAIPGTAAAVPAALAMIAFAWATVALVQVLLHHPSTRRETTAALTPLTIGALGVGFADPAMFPGGRGTIGSAFVVLSAVCGLLVARWRFRCAPLLVADGRLAELRLLTAWAVMIPASAASSLDYTHFFAAPPLVALVLTATAAYRPGAAVAGTPVRRGPVLVAVPFRWGVVAAGAAGAVVPLVGLGAPPALTVPLVPVSLLGAWWFVREVRRPPVRRRPVADDAGVAVLLPTAIVDGEFDVVLQPIVRLADGAVVGHEALVRWRHPTLAARPVLEVVECAARTDWPQRWTSPSPRSP